MCEVLMMVKFDICLFLEYCYHLGIHLIIFSFMKCYRHLTGKEARWIIQVELLTISNFGGILECH